jgi:rhamnose utilization protein RhaD (predicted bifunctional aldolase and dehydrogenase)
MEADLVLKQLIDLSHELGREDRGLAILGEGNTSADCGDGTFWVKASGFELSTIEENGFSRVSMDAVLELLARDNLTDEQVSEGLQIVLVDKTQRKPSVETFLHALCIHETGARWVGHCHPISVLKILSSKMGAEPFLQHLFPDGIVVCGPNPVVVPYIDPGFRLALAVRDALRSFQDRHGDSPRIMLMENHGLLVLGQTPKDILGRMMMTDKWAKIIEGTYTFGGPNYLPETQVNRIENRPDEHYRRRILTD